MLTRFITRRGGKAALLVAMFALLPAARASAKLEDKEWTAAEAEWQRLFTAPGNCEEKGKLARTLESDGQNRAWRLLTDALVQECLYWAEAKRDAAKLFDEIAVVLAIPYKDRYPAQDQAMMANQAALVEKEKEALTERAVIDDLVGLIAKGPAELRLNILARAKGPVDWPFRAAAAGIAAAEPLEKESAGFLVRTFTQD